MSGLNYSIYEFEGDNLPENNEARNDIIAKSGPFDRPENPPPCDFFRL